MENEKSSTIEVAKTQLPPLIKRGYLSLEDSDWKNAEKFFNDALNQDPENAHAYIGLLLAELKVKNIEELKSGNNDFSKNVNYEKALRFSEEDLRGELEDCYRESVYTRAKAELNENNTKKIETAKKMLESIPEYKDSASYIAQCEEKLSTLHKEKAAKKKKIIIAVISALLLIVVISIIVIINKTKANQQRAELLYQNFLGTKFEGSYVDDQGFTNDYRYNRLQNKAYFKTEETYILVFNEDGTVDCEEYYEYVLLAAPNFMQSQMKQLERSHHNSNKAQSFSVRVALNGQAYVTIGYTEYEIYGYDSPSTIRNYGSMYKTNLDKKITINWPSSNN